jgi:predicted PurR-regulated permease PerM
MGVLIAGSLWVLRPFVPALLWATMIVVSTWPFMLRLQAWLGGRRGAAVAVMTLLLLLLLFVPLYLAVSTLLEQSDRIVSFVHNLPTLRLPPPPQWVNDLPLIGHRAAAQWLALASLDPTQLADQLAPYIKKALVWFAAQAGGFGTAVVHFLLTVLVSAILYAKGEGAAGYLRRFFRRLAGPRGDKIVTLSGSAIRAVALGIVVTAVVQSALAGIGLVAVGFPLAGVVSAVVFILCIAQIGPIPALVPCVLWLYAAGSAGRATVLLIVTVLAQVIDNVLRPLLIKRGANLSLLLIFPGVVGGLLWLGIIGLFIGPLLLAVTSTLLDDWIASGVGENAPEDEAHTAVNAGEGPPPGVGTVSVPSDREPAVSKSGTRASM